MMRNVSIYKTHDTYQAAFQEWLGVQLALRHNLLFLAFVVDVQSYPDLAEIKLFDETFSDLVPLRIEAAGPGGAKCRPVAVVEKNFETCLAVEFTGGHIEHNNTRLCGI